MACLWSHQDNCLATVLTGCWTWETTSLIQQGFFYSYKVCQLHSFMPTTVPWSQNGIVSFRNHKLVDSWQRIMKSFSSCALRSHINGKMKPSWFSSDCSLLQQPNSVKQLGFQIIFSYWFRCKRMSNNLVFSLIQGSQQTAINPNQGNLQFHSCVQGEREEHCKPYLMLITNKQKIALCSQYLDAKQNCNDNFRNLTKSVWLTLVLESVFYNEFALN